MLTVPRPALLLHHFVWCVIIMGENIVGIFNHKTRYDIVYVFFLLHDTRRRYKNSWNVLCINKTLATDCHLAEKAMSAGILCFNSGFCFQHALTRKKGRERGKNVWRNFLRTRAEPTESQPADIPHRQHIPFTQNEWLILLLGGKEEKEEEILAQANPLTK